jgi:hypothetical protein
LCNVITIMTNLFYWRFNYLYYFLLSHCINFNSYDIKLWMSVGWGNRMRRQTYLYFLISHKMSKKQCVHTMTKLKKYLFAVNQQSPSHPDRYKLANWHILVLYWCTIYQRKGLFKRLDFIQTTVYSRHFMLRDRLGKHE